MFKKKVEPKAKESEPELIPETAGEPTIAIRKEWLIGNLRVTDFDGEVHIEELQQFGGIWVPSFTGVRFPRSRAKAIANALLQAAP